MPTRLFEAGASDVLYLVDLSGYVFRAYHAIAPLNSPSGEPTNAVFGTVNMLERLVRQCKPQLLAVAMDSRTPTFRKELFPAYKAHRPPPPPDLKQQMARVSEVVDAFPIACFQHDGVEADDLIATVVDRCRRASLRVVIVSADKDLMQLVGDDVLLWDTMRDRVFGPDEVKERFGVELPQIRDVLALMGDSSDNIPGVPSVGPKTAKDLIVEFGTIDEIYANLDKIKRKKLRETLTENEQQARMSQRLVTLKADIEIDFSREHLGFERKSTSALRALYADLGFTRQLANLAPEEPTEDSGIEPASTQVRPPRARSFDVTTVETGVVLDASGLDEVSRAAGRVGKLALYPCYHGGAPLTAAWIGLAVATGSERGLYIPLSHRYMGAPTQLGLKPVGEWLRSLIADPTIQLVAEDAKSLMVLLREHDIELEKCDFDVMLASYLLDSGAAHELERIAKTELDAELVEYDSRFKQKGKRRTPFDELTVEDAADFAARRAAVIYALRDRMETRLDEENLGKLYREMELPLTPLLAHMERYGILLDTAGLERLGAEVGARLVELERKAHAVAGKDFNVNSPRQLEKILFDELRLKPLKRTKTSRSTDAATLEALAEEHELPRVILEVRGLAKLKGTYIDSLPGLVNERTGRLHTRWHQEVAATGRLSSSDPNLQNIPIRSELGRSIRAAFIAPPGYTLVSADYSQIELRVLAHLSQDPVLLDAFRTNQDIHQRTAMEIFEVDADEVDDELRRQAKAVNFGVIYGQGDSALAKSLGISRMEAGQFIAAYFRRYQGVQRFMDATLETARASGTVRTLFGRRRLVPDIHHNNRARRLAAERIVMNAPIQGTAADLLKMAMLALREPVTPGARMLLTVHDELVFEVPTDEVATAKETVRDAMQDVYPLDVPLVVDVGSGPNWKAAH
jgi:DNA polymerase-1